MSTYYATDGKLGVPSLVANSAPDFTPGTTARINGNEAIIYVYADETCAAGTGIKINAAFTASVSAGAATTIIVSANAGQWTWAKVVDLTLNTA